MNFLGKSSQKRGLTVGESVQEVLLNDLFSEKDPKNEWSPVATTF
jgi:hypothetical protein